MAKQLEADEKSTRDAELLISTVLRIGVVTSFVLVVVGVIITFVRTPAFMQSPVSLGHLHTPGGAPRHTLHAIISGLTHLDGPVIVLTGLVLLVATPVIRVAASILIFLRERDTAFVVITTAVLSLLLLSFFLGGTAG